VAVNITVHPLYSPRIIEVDYPQTEVTIQDLHDACRAWEDETDNQQWDHLISTDGKQPLGGSVTVGLTAELNNAQVYFPSRSTPLDNTQTCTTGDPTGMVLYSVGSTFEADGLVRGDMVFNATTGALATILVVDGEEQLTHLVLTGGSRNDWQVGDEVWTYNNEQCSVSGGNLTAVDENGDPLAAILPSAMAQVVRTASSSATLAELADLQYASFNGGVTVDLVNGTAGTTYPTGTPRQPVDNFTDAITIANARGFGTLFIVGDATIDTGLDFTGMVFIGESKTKSVLTVDAAANVTRSEFVDATVTGTLDGEAKLLDCVIQTLNFINGFVEQCVLEGTITLGGSEEAHFLDCWSGVPGAGTPTIDMGGSGQALALRNYNGGIKLTNKNGSDAVSVDLNSGQVILDSATFAGTGTIIVRGVGKLVDENGVAISTGTWNGTVDVVNEITNAEQIADATFAKSVSDGFDLSEALRVFASVWAGNLVRSGDTYSYRSPVDPDRVRVTGTVDAQGNRTVTLVDLDP